MKEIKIECPSCEGTGLYKGMCERDGCAVVCTECDGKGYTTYRYNDFTGKKVKEGITRVFQKTCGYVHSDKNHKSDKGIIHFENYGCTYQEWLNGAEPKPMEELYCPHVYYNRGIGNEPLEKCKQYGGLGNLITDCPLYSEKKKCWKEYHALHRNNVDKRQ